MLCRNLDGIPLAIELAAARTKVLSVARISSRLAENFRLLKSTSRTADPRQQTLAATLEWSHELLGETERAVFRRLSVFAGGFTLGAAERVCAGGGIEEDDVLDLLTRLIDKSLVSVAEYGGAEARYRPLETVRQYGWEKLLESGEAEGARRRHAGYYLALAEEAEPELSGAQEGIWLERLEAEHPNLRAALGTLVEVLERTVPFEEFEEVIRAALGRLEAEGVKELVSINFYGSPDSTEVGAILIFSDGERVLEHMGMVSSWEEFRRFFGTVKPLDVRVYGKLPAEAGAWISQFGDVVSKNSSTTRLASSAKRAMLSYLSVRPAR